MAIKPNQIVLTNGSFPLGGASGVGSLAIFADKVNETLVGSIYDYQLISSNNFTFAFDTKKFQYVIGANNTFATNLIITLPLISQKSIVIIKDQSFTSNKYKITINPSGANTIDNDTSFIINSKGASVSFYNDGSTKWFSF